MLRREVLAVNETELLFDFFLLIYCFGVRFDTVYFPPAWLSQARIVIPVFFLLLLFKCFFLVCVCSEMKGRLVGAKKGYDLLKVRTVFVFVFHRCSFLA